MTDGERQKSDSFESAKAALDAVAPQSTTAATETVWDKPAPTAPPGLPRKQYADWFMPLLRHFQQIITDETVFAELCLERAVELVQGVHNRGLVGIDHFADVTGQGGGATRTNLMTAAIPYAVEFYKQCTVALNKREGEFTLAWNEAKALMELEQKKKIVVAGR